jgi:DNA helicase-2/ATP-dependent DNA helicase PcrA
MSEWRGGSVAAQQGWADAGIAPRSGAEIVRRWQSEGKAGSDYAEGMLVRHETYGQGRITDVSGYGAMRKVKIRFATAGERTFLVEKAKLTILHK